MSNLHSKQTGTQLHKPDKHSDAPRNSLLTKTRDDSVGYVEGLQSHSTEITPTADVSGSTNNKYFIIYSKQISKKYAVWYNVGGTGSFTTPDGCDGLIEVTIAADDIVATIIDNTITALAAKSGDGGYVLYDSITDGTTSFTIVQTNSVPTTDASTGWGWLTESTDNTADTHLVSQAITGELVFERNEGTRILSTGETGGTKFLREDGDGTCSWQTPSGASGVTTFINTADTGATPSASGGVNINILGGTGITTSAGVGGVTISESVESKPKADIDDLTGVTGTNLGTFTGSTITDEVSIKAALQELETKLETNISYHNNSVRWAAFNLDGTSSTSGTNDGWVFNEPNNNKDCMFNQAVDTSDMSYQYGVRAAIEVPITGITTKLIGGTCISSGESGNAYKITIWKADLDGGSGTGMTMTLMGTFSIAGSSNDDPDEDAISLEASANCTLAAGDGVIMVMEDIETYSDMDCRGVITLRFEDTW